VFMTVHFLLIVSQFNPNFTDKYFINNIINQVIKNTIMHKLMPSKIELLSKE